MSEKTLREAIEEAYKAIGKDPRNAIGKKLKTKNRKKMKKSVYCGPQNSFPCNDCKHVAIAKAYLARSKFSKCTKKKIAASINRRAEVLKCSVSKTAKATELNYFNMSVDEKRLYNSKIFNETRKLVNKSFKEKGMDLNFNGSC